MLLIKIMVILLIVLIFVSVCLQYIYILIFKYNSELINLFIFILEKCFLKNIVFTFL